MAALPLKHMSAAERHVASMADNADLCRYEIRLHYKTLNAIAEKYMQDQLKRSLNGRDAATVKFSVAKIRELTRKLHTLDNMASALHKLNCEKKILDSERALVGHINPVLKSLHKRHKQPISKNLGKNVDRYLESQTDMYPVSTYVQELGNSDMDFQSVYAPNQDLDYGEIFKNCDMDSNVLHEFLSTMYASNLHASLPDVPTKELQSHETVFSADCNKIT